MKQLVFLTLTAAVAGSLAAQSNTVPGLDGRLTQIDTFTYQGRRGAAYPNGEVAASMMNEMCNPGSVTIPWFAAMQTNHPKFGFIMVRVANDKIEQVSDWSFCKHAFISTNSPSSCGSCVPAGGGTVMGIGCSDIYGVGNNNDRTTLGPPSELNPWLGTWGATGSYFDIGDPAQAGYPASANGAYSLNTSGFDNVKNRVIMREQDLITPGAKYYYGIHLMHEGEAVANRGDNLAHRGCNPVFGGSTWTFANNGDAQQWGTVLQRWNGATIGSGQNGNDDGRFFVAVKTTALGGGQYHYEYAIHNVDNNRAGATFRLPIDPAAVASNFTFGDIDTNAANDWTAARVGNEVVFSAPAGNALRWNTIYNFGFDANYQPGFGNASIDEAFVGPGGLTVTVNTKVPAGPPAAEYSVVGTGCANCRSSFYEVGGFDLANSKIQLTYGTGGYSVGPSTATYVAPSGGSLGLTDETDASFALPFTLPYPGGSTNTLRICSNGYISVSTGNGISYQPSSAAFLGSAVPRWAPCWHDFNPAGANNVYVNTAPGVVRVTWLNVPNWTAPAGSSTVQAQFYSNGDVHFLYNAVSLNADSYLVGWTRGNNAADPGNRDISATIGTGFSTCTSDVTGIDLAVSARPVIGTTINLVTSNLPASTLAGFQMLGFASFIPGFDLTTILDMPGCFAYTLPDISVTFTPTGSSNSMPFTIPLDNTLNGQTMMVQTLTISPGFNPASLLTTNGVQLLFGSS